MRSLELQYDAVHLPCDTYFTDSGGGWQRSSDPLDHDLSNGRHQILIHPEYWRGAKKLYFFLSTARSGSLWLSEVLNKATPLKARHEYILNQDFHRGETARKATANFRALEDEPETVIAKLSEAWEELEGLKDDWAEVNVYLASFVEELRRFFREAFFIHLHRNPSQVVRSLMDRNWYDTPHDHAHPRLRTADAATLNRFERVCQYVAEINTRLHEACDAEVSLQELTQSPASLDSAFRRLGVPYYPRLGDQLTAIVINATKTPKFPSVAQWSLEKKWIYNQRVGQICCALNYRPLIFPSLYSIVATIRAHYTKCRDVWHRRVTRSKMDNSNRSIEKFALNVNRVKGVNCEISVEGYSIVIRPQTAERHAYLTLGGSDWHALKKTKSGHSGWPVLPNNYVQGSLEMWFFNSGSVTIFAICYGADMKQLYRRQLGVMDARHPRLEFAFAPHPEASTFDIAIYMSASRSYDKIIIKEWRLNKRAHQIQKIKRRE
jgi:hypothetical protein